MPAVESIIMDAIGQALPQWEGRFSPRFRADGQTLPCGVYRVRRQGHGAMNEPCTLYRYEIELDVIDASYDDARAAAGTIAATLEGTSIPGVQSVRCRDMAESDDGILDGKSDADRVCTLVIVAWAEESV